MTPRLNCCGNVDNPLFYFISVPLLRTNATLHEKKRKGDVESRNIAEEGTKHVSLPLRKI